MTLDEAIKNCEEEAEKNEKAATWFWVKEGNPNYEEYIKCAEEHRQLAEWLKELKQLKEQEPCEDIKEYFKDIWNCDINHPKYEDTVAEIVEKSYISGYAHGLDLKEVKKQCLK